MNKGDTSLNIIKASFLTFFILCVFFPILSMLARMDIQSITDMLGSKRFSLALRNSLYVSFISSIISISFAFLFAYIISRINIKCKNEFLFIFTLPMLIPSISHSFSLVALFGTNGFFTKILRLKLSIYGARGIIIGSIMYSFPVAFLMIYNILQYEDISVYHVAEILGIPKINRLIRITLPYAKKTLMSTFFAVFAMVITDYGVPLAIGGKCITLPVLMYNKVLGELDFASGSVIGSILLLPAFLAFLFEMLVSNRSANNTIAKREYFELNPIKTIIVRVFFILSSLVIIAPILVFCIVAFCNRYPIKMNFTFYHAIRTLHKGGGTFLFNSLLYASLSAILGCVISFVCAYITSRNKGKISSILHFLIMATMSIPGVVLGLSYIIFFSKSFIYGTVIIIVLANMLHFLTSPYLMMCHSLEKVNSNIEFVGLTLGVRRFRIITDVLIPKVKPTLMEMFSYYFVNSMITISAVSFLAPPSPKPISLMISQFESQLLIESAALVSLIIFIVNCAIEILFMRLQQSKITC